MIPLRVWRLAICGHPSGLTQDAIVANQGKHDFVTKRVVYIYNLVGG